MPTLPAANDPETLAIMRPDEPRVFSTYVRDFTLICGERVLRDAPRGGVAEFAFVRRGASVAKADFHAAWGHGPVEGWLAAPALRGALRVVHNTVVQPAPTSNEYDGIAEWWFASSGADRAAFAGRDIRAQLPPAYAAIADVAGTVFMFRHVTHSRP